ncbi:uncharacterized protein F5147DRAFT_656407 [Suillus discolor]|uniref:Uncharacterized protein n=1 Tax=Suillus discolor TaxID=1912936 RepID=A0A9P7JPY9_9AGAM|nr:uncharacterized protein F5147DRAFT_656407 [Suillus discolor]KAG2097275.1 hypothetical protein F5147DRAFT_656407 [Suillus discolor]
MQLTSRRIRMIVEVEIKVQCVLTRNVVQLKEHFQVGTDLKHENIPFDPNDVFRAYSASEGQGQTSNNDNHKIKVIVDLSGNTSTEPKKSIGRPSHDFNNWKLHQSAFYSWGLDDDLHRSASASWSQNRGINQDIGKRLRHAQHSRTTLEDLAQELNIDILAISDVPARLQAPGQPKPGLNKPSQAQAQVMACPRPGPRLQFWKA